MNHYETLGIERSATPAEIKKAYKRMAKKHHPDRKGGDSSTMALVNLAHDTLMDPAKRAHYDATGENKPIDSIDIQAKNGLIQLFVTYLQSAERINVPKRAKLDLEAAMSKLQDAKRQIEREVAKLVARREEVTAEGEENLWTQVIDQAAHTAQQKIAEADHKLAITKRACEMLMAYRSGVVEQAMAGGPLSSLLAQQMHASMRGMRF